MKKILIFTVLILALLAGCSNEPDFVDNGQPGTIRAVVFNDLNDNNFLDEGEAASGELVGVVAAGPCPPSSRDAFTIKETGENGEAIFEVTPGKYCVRYLGNRRPGTQMNFEIFVSSEEQVSVGIGLTD